ncbi:hypothetical protein MLD38_028049 [Melastoma candidum]|uniref:Uncharacterized protein n=1 Tax=Melastoma candidum TaxID=119954 RepID=A0ACB9N217_9MYRT|nr:hypothetical protein MLD38_028049 [Melastoma candidum]
MAKISNTIVTVLNAATAIISILAIALSVYYHVHRRGSTQCQKFVRDPLLISGTTLLVVSLVGIVGSVRKMNSFLYVYLGLMLFFLVGMAAITVFTFVVTNEGAGRVHSGRGYKEYRLGDYSHWLQKYVGNQRRRREIRGCLMDAEVCHGLGRKDNEGLRAADVFFQLNLSPIQSGCCKPPRECCFEFRNATYWAIANRSAAPGGPVVRNEDCTKWSNDQNKLCYNCNSCKAGFLANIRQQWRQLLVFNTCVMVVVLLSTPPAVAPRRTTGWNSGSGGWGGVHELILD